MNNVLACLSLLPDFAHPVCLTVVFPSTAGHGAFLSNIPQTGGHSAFMEHTDLFLGEVSVLDHQEVVHSDNAMSK